MAFMLVQHLDPDRASALVEILRGCTRMPVSPAEDGAKVRPNEVFVIPPDAILKIESGVLRVARPETAAARRTSVDTFLRSLAEDQGENAVGIILSGFGADGSLGVEAVKAHGGLTLAQAEFDHAPKAGMPQSATAHGFVDHVLPIADMPAALVDYLRYRSSTDHAKGPDGVREDVADHLGAICAVLNARLGKDFSQYKTNTLLRRVQRRMQVLQIADVSTYVEQLRERPDEPELLFREVVIRVTRFFRDPEAFESLASRIPTILAEGEPQDAVRVWVPGCASGEEAYTVAILFKEAMARASVPRKVQIFATDIDDQAIELARAGLYAEAIIADVPEALLDRHFVKEAEGLRISKDIRQMCLFSVHDLVKDPPFSRLSLISCRNLLIYFAPPLQKRVIAMFHYGLKPGGNLFLGSSEAVSAHARLFSPIDKKHRLFVRNDAPSQLILATSGLSGSPRSEVSSPAENGQEEPLAAKLMSRYLPAFVVIDRRQNIRQFSGVIAKYLEPSGAANLNLSRLVHGDLRAPLRGGLKQVAETGARSIQEGLAIHIGGRREAVNLIVEPLIGPGLEDGLVIVGFQDLGPLRFADAAPSAQGAMADKGALAELVAARERLQTMSEELETANEELQSSNEEYQSVNEELQSTNEELETSKEELQSINEELATVNAELNVRNESLAAANSDLANLIDSTAIATLFLDRDMRIKRFTPAVLDIFNVRKGDEGRPITDIVSHLARDGLSADVQRVMRTLAPVQREVALLGGKRTFQMHIRPYRDINDVINGVTVTFVDISARKLGERERANLAAIVASSEDAIFGHDLNSRITSWNAAAEAIFGYTAEEIIGQPMTKLMNEAQAAEWPAILNRLLKGETIQHFDSTRVTKAGRVADVSMALSPIRDIDGIIVGVSAIARDIADRRRTERQTTLLLGELDHRVKNILAIVSSVITHTLKTVATPQEFAATMEGRIGAIARAHNQLTSGGEGGVSLLQILDTELAPHEDVAHRVAIGRHIDVTLTPRAAIPIAMAIHELATNATKYGALSAEAGRVRIGLEVAEEGGAPALTIRWTESGGPPVPPEPRRGFGTTLIERTLSYQFDAEVDRVFAADGLRCIITIPLIDDVGQVRESLGRASP